MAKLNEYDELFYEGNATKPPFNKKRIMTHDEMIAVIQAHKEGKTIQFKQYNGDWYDCKGNKPIWNFDRFSYRIKPEPKYRPYESAEEFLQAQKEHGMYLYLKSNCAFKLATSINTGSIAILWDSRMVEEIEYADLFERATWSDGSPCGVKEEE